MDKESYHEPIKVKGVFNDKYEPIKVKGVFNDNYIEYVSNGKNYEN